MTRCLMCKRLLDVPGDELSRDCGGDCWGCIRDIEQGIDDPRPEASPEADE